jgi:hypothetical protein
LSSTHFQYARASLGYLAIQFSAGH